jgi:hypothetical protein
MRLPSGDQTGNRFTFPSKVKRDRVPRAKSYSQRSIPPALRGTGTATALSSGEIAGAG